MVERFPFPEEHPDRDLLEIERLSQRVGNITLVVLGEGLRLIDEERENRRAYGNLGRVINLPCLALLRRRRTVLQDGLHHSVQLTRACPFGSPLVEMLGHVDRRLDIPCIL